MYWATLGQGSTGHFLTAILVFLLSSTSGYRPKALRWGRSSRQPLIRGDFARCDWTQCVPTAFTQKAQGCVNSGEILKGNPETCEGGGFKYFCCKYSGEDTVGYRGGPQPKIEPRQPPFVNLKETFLTRIEQKLSKFRHWLKTFQTQAPWDHQREMEKWKRKWSNRIN